MRWRLLLGSLALLVRAQESLSASSLPSGDRCFPDEFMFGSATASYQVEGAVNETGRTPSIWDDFCRDQSEMQCGNVADDFFHRYKQDIQLMANAGLQSFRFSISWSRAMNWDPTSKRMVRNQPGIDFYHSLIDELLRHDLAPILTLYHWDLPRELHTELSPQGWLNSDIVGHFEQYAQLVFCEFGRKIDYWATFNEPWSFTVAGYGNGMHAPGFKNSSTNAYVAGHNLLISHARAVARFRELKTINVVRSSAQIGIVLVTHFSYPLNADDPRDVAAAERRTDFMLGWYLKPIVSGDYPPIMREIAGDRLPQFTSAESRLLKGSYDLLMLNYYVAQVVTDCGSESSSVDCASLPLGFERDMGIDDSRMPPGARKNCLGYATYAPGYLQAIKWMHNHDPNASILLTENGWCDDEEIENQDQLWYLQTHLDQVHKAITEENIPVIGYTVWSFMDNYEWGSFKPRFGLYYVDFPASIGDRSFYTPKSSDLTRIPRLAGRWFSNLAKTKCLVASDAQAKEVLQLSTQFESSDDRLSPLLVVVVVCLVAALAVAGISTIKRRASGRAQERAPLLVPASAT